MPEKQQIEETQAELVHFVPLELEDCKVPVGCPWGCDCPDDVVPNHHEDNKDTGGGGGGGW